MSERGDFPENPTESRRRENQRIRLNEVEIDSESSPPEVIAGQSGPAFTVNEFREQLLRPRTIISFVVALAVVLIFVARTDLDLTEVWRNIREADLLLLLLAFLAFYSTLFLRAVRWRWMLRINGAGSMEGTSLPAALRLTEIFAVSWGANCIVPAKLGDGYRAYRVRRDAGIRYGIGLGTIVSERIVDLIVLVAMMAAMGIVAFRGSVPQEVNRAAILGMVLVAGALIGLVGIWLTGNRFSRRLPDRFVDSYGLFRDSILVVMRRPALPVGFAVVIWLLEGGRVYLVAESVGAGISLETAIFVAMMSALLTTLPFTPAGLGVVEVAMIAALKLADVPAEVAGSVAVLDRLITYWSVIVVGAISFFLINRASGPRPELTPQLETE